MLFACLDRLDEADARIDRAVRGLGALLGRVLQPELAADPSSAPRPARPSRTRRHRRRSVRPARDRPRPSSGWRPRRSRTSARWGCRRARRRSRPRRGSASPASAPACRQKVPCAATSLPSLVAPILTLLVEPEVGPEAWNTSLARHHHLHRPAGLLRQEQRQRLRGRRWSCRRSRRRSRRGWRGCRSAAGPSGRRTWRGP